MIKKNHTADIQSRKSRLFILYGLSISFVVSFVLLFSNVYGFSIADTKWNINVAMYISTNFTEGSSRNHSQMDMIDMMKRGDIAMGFNQSKISHQFITTPNGGKIVITALDNKDNQTISQIKNHAKDIQKQFTEGNFTKPFFIHAQNVPGTDVMTKKKDLIDYNIAEMKNGSSLLLHTNDKELINAISQFMKFQATEHEGH